MALFAFFVVQNLNGPLLGPNDYNQFLNQIYSLTQNLRFDPFPRIELHTDETLYPFGTSHVFRDWSLERDLITTAFLKVFGVGPWLQLYYLFSVGVIAIGCYVLLVRDHGRIPAAWVGFVASFLNFYAIAKFPGHMSIAVLHWTTLGIVTDYLIFRRLIIGSGWSARLLMLRLALLFLALGQGIAYVAGYALTSFCIMAFFVVIVSWWRNRRLWPWTRKRCGEWLSYLSTSARKTPRSVILFFLVSALAFYFFVPLLLQITIEVRSFDFHDVNKKDIVRYGHPIRILSPILPFTPPMAKESLLGDRPEGYFEGGGGLFLFIAAVAGFVCSRRHRLMMIPALTLLVMGLSYHPDHFPILRVFPWFGFSRVAGRTTAIYPVILALTSIPFIAAVWRTRALRYTLLVCASLMVVESTVAYSRLTYPKNYLVPDDRFHALMEEVRKSPGEALLDWPFCITGGNGTGSTLASYYPVQSGINALRLFHEKKIVSDYLGRLHPRQTKPFIDAGWEEMFFPDRSREAKERCQERDFDPKEWSFMDRFFTLNDFCGILVYVDLLHPETVTGLAERYGKPVAEANIYPAGRVQFIRKPRDLFRLVDKKKGREVSLRRDERSVVSQVMPPNLIPTSTNPPTSN